MNPDFPSRLAAQLRANPSLFEESDDSMLADLIFHYAEGELDAAHAAEVAALIESDPKAKTIYERIEAAARFATSPAGDAWLNNLRDRVTLSRRPATPVAPAPAFFDRLSEWLTSLFPSLALQAAYSDSSDGSTEHEFPSPADDPYRASLVRDAAGQWRLLVFTSNADAAKLKVRLEIKEEAPVLSFVEGEPGHFLGEVLLTEEMAQALQSGNHRPVFHPFD